MLFHSPVFIFGFLPVTLVLTLLAELYGPNLLRWVIVIVASFVFYAYFKIEYTILLAVSMAFNFHFSKLVAGEVRARHSTAAKLILGIAIAANLISLGVFKYSDFLIANANYAFSADLSELHLILPLAISFFTFQQIAYLLDVYRDPSRSVKPVEYVFFTTLFPHLIAGPICYGSDIVPQMHLRRTSGEIGLDLASGGVAFIIGLFKKVVLASYFQGIADNGFIASAGLDAATGWLSVIAYSLQIYFDFSAYSDMAVGLGLMLGIRLPLNFYSPYKSSSIIEFWRCWHITLSRFLRDDLYIPLGGSRRGRYRTAVNLITVMTLAGMWHGAGWTFILWGAIHGTMLILNHAWRALSGPPDNRPAAAELAIVWCKRIATFALVTLAWIPFRAASFAQAESVFLSLCKLPVALPPDLGLTSAALAMGVGICLLLPNTAQLLRQYRPVCTLPPADLSFEPSRFDALRVQLNLRWAFVTALLLFAAIHASIGRSVDMFIYFQF